MAIIAARYGHKDALRYLIYAGMEGNNQYFANQVKGALYQLTGETFSSAKMRKWYKGNQVKLVFDPDNEEYTIKGN